MYTYPLFRPVVRTTCCMPALKTCQAPAKVPAQACCWMPIRCPKNAWSLRFFPAHESLLLNAHQMPKEMFEASDFFPAPQVKVCCFWPCVSWKFAKFSRWWSWKNIFKIFSVFVSVILELAQIHPVTNCGKFHCELHVGWYRMNTPADNFLQLYWDLAKNPSQWDAH